MMESMDQTDEMLLSGSLDKFAWELYKTITNDTTTNIFFSPYSIGAALTMTYAGAKNETARQMSKVLHLDGIEDVHGAFRILNGKILSPSASYALKSANRLYGQEGFDFQETFMETTKQNYQTSLCPVDFKTAAEDARSAINAWVFKQTNSKINNMLAPGLINAMTVLVLVNAVYFKGNWLDAFDKARTYKALFNSFSGDVSYVDMMYKTDSFGYLEDEARRCQILSLPYKGRNLSMVLILPSESKPLSKLESEITPEVVMSWINASVSNKVHVHLPRFKLETSFTLNKELTKMGMTELFQGDKADLTGITKSDPLYISHVIHKAFVEVNEEGTEAAAATVAITAFGCAMPMKPTPTFKADRPFIFLIHHNRSKAILFLGRLVRPAKQ